jgi:peptidoglycan-N-acetylglucosamine deacetylase
MKRKSILFVAIVFSTICSIGFSQTKSATYEVATWKGFREAAISYTFDDNCPNQLPVAIPMFNEFGFQTTMFVPSDWIKDWSALQTAADQGHEIASHTVTHTNLGSLNTAQQLVEFKNSQESINAHIKGRACLTIAYPYCVPGNDSLCASFYIAARHCQGYIEPKTPSDFMKISSLATGNVSSIQTVGDFNSRVQKADSLKGWCVFLIHGIDNDSGYSPTQSSVLRAHLAYVKQQNNSYWVAPFGDVVRYIKERNAVLIHELSNKPTAITLQVTDTLDNTVYNYPITIRRPLPKHWTSATVTQNGKKVEAKVSKKGTLKYITFDVVPDGGNVIIKAVKG